jgi:hypothetical protein
LGAPLRDYPGRRPPLTVPFGGRDGSRRLPKARPKLTRLEKKALKWARKHPEQEGTSNWDRPWQFHGRIRVFETGVTNTPTFVTNANPYLGHLGTVGTIGTDDIFQGNYFTGVTQGIYLNGNLIGNQFQTNATAGAGITLHAAPIARITITTSAATTVTIPMTADWITWNAECCRPAEWATADERHFTHNPLTRPQTEWAGWQGRGHQADLWVNPNDHVQRARIQRERRLAEEARYQQQRMQQAAADAEQRRRYEIEEKERQERRKTALKRSYELLFRHLTEAQKNMLESENRFLIEVKSGKVYEIRRGTHQNVFRLDDRGRTVEQLCGLPMGQLPEGDVMLAQMLRLMVDEEGFRKIANRWELRDISGEVHDRRLPLTDGAIVVDRRAAAG